MFLFMTSEPPSAIARTTPPPAASSVDGSEAITERAVSDRRGTTKRRVQPRRLDELRTFHNDRDFGRIGTLAAMVATTVAVWALINAPVTGSPTTCTDTLGAEVIHHREIHPLWIVAMLLSALAIALPSRPRRSYVSVGLVGLTIGLAVAACIRVATWKTGLCFV